MLRKTKQSLLQWFFSTRFIIPEFTATHKIMKKFASEIFKRTRSGEMDAEEDPRIEGRVDKNIQDK